VTSSKFSIGAIAARSGEFVLNVLCFGLKTFGHEQPALPNDGISGTLGKRSIPGGQFAELVRAVRNIKYSSGCHAAARHCLPPRRHIRSPPTSSDRTRYAGRLGKKSDPCTTKLAGAAKYLKAERSSRRSGVEAVCLIDPVLDHVCSDGIARSIARVLLESM
jgi:hypothetical protein